MGYFCIFISTGQREGDLAVTNSRVIVYVSYLVSFYFFSSSDLHKYFSLLDDTDDISVLKLNKRLSYCSVTHFLYYLFLKRLKSTQANNHVISYKNAT